MYLVKYIFKVINALKSFKHISVIKIGDKLCFI